MEVFFTAIAAGLIGNWVIDIARKTLKYWNIRSVPKIVIEVGGLKVEFDPEDEGSIGRFIKAVETDEVDGNGQTNRK